MLKTVLTMTTCDAVWENKVCVCERLKVLFNSTKNTAKLTLAPTLVKCANVSYPQLDMHYIIHGALQTELENKLGFSLLHNWKLWKFGH